MGGAGQGLLWHVAAGGDASGTHGIATRIQ